MNSLVLDISECVQYIRHTHLVSFNCVMDDRDIFKMFDIVCNGFVEEFPRGDFPTDCYAEAHLLICNKLVTTVKQRQALYNMFNFVHHKTMTGIQSLRITELNGFNYYIYSINGDYAYFVKLPY